MASKSLSSSKSPSQCALFVEILALYDTNDERDLLVIPIDDLVPLVVLMDAHPLVDIKGLDLLFADPSVDLLRHLADLTEPDVLLPILLLLPVLCHPDALDHRPDAALPSDGDLCAALDPLFAVLDLLLEDLLLEDLPCADRPCAALVLLCAALVLLFAVLALLPEDLPYAGHPFADPDLLPEDRLCVDRLCVDRPFAVLPHVVLDRLPCAILDLRGIEGVDHRLPMDDSLDLHDAGCEFVIFRFSWVQ